MHSTLIALAVVVLGITATLSAPLEQLHGSHRPKTREEQINYLRQFGHWREPRNERTDSDEDLGLSLMDFQSSSGLKTTGEYDDATKELMATPRCGVVDGNEVSGRRKRFTVFGESNTWPITSLTYSILNYTPDLPTVQTESIIAQAFKYWSDVSSLTFTELNGTEDANITLSFVPRDHGDDSPFDGPGVVLAHGAPYPYGLVHFDEEEQWSGNSTSGFSLLWVAVHEIGHALGLNHSALNSAVMYSHFEGRTVNTLDPDDISGIQSLYAVDTEQEFATIPYQVDLHYQ